MACTKASADKTESNSMGEAMKILLVLICGMILYGSCVTCVAHHVARIAGN